MVTPQGCFSVYSSLCFLVVPTCILVLILSWLFQSENLRILKVSQKKFTADGSVSEGMFLFRWYWAFINLCGIGYMSR